MNSAAQYLQRRNRHQRGYFGTLAHYTLAIATTLLFFVSTAFASQTGKLAGLVVDSAGGGPIVGAQVVAIGTSYAALTDEDGEFFILEVPAGVYEIQVIAIGYEMISQIDTRVLLDLTTPVNFILARRETQINEPIVVTAPHLQVQKDLTATRYTVTSEQLAYLPNASTVADVLANMSGAVVDKDGSVHIRGGRSGAITYIFDGVTVTDPVTRTLGIRIVPDALEEINMTSGGFPAEYGEAGSAVVNAVTREGGANFRGAISVYDGASHTYDRYSGKLGPLERSESQALRVNLSGPLTIPGFSKTNFFIASEGFRDGGYLPHNFEESRHLSGKITTRPMPALKLTMAGSWNETDQDYYDHRDQNGFSYDLNLDGLGRTKRSANVFSAASSYTFNPTTVAQATVGRFVSEFKLAPTHLFDQHWSEWPGFVADSTGAYDPANGTIHVDNYNIAAEYGYTGYTYGQDFQPRYSYRKTSYNMLNGSVTKQLDKRNQIKVGGERRTYDVAWDEKQFFNPVPYGENYNYFPTYNYFYAQHKLEYQDLILNFGLRYDDFDSRVDYLKFIPNPGNTMSYTFEPRRSTPKTQWSPRLGVSFPVGPQTIMRFNYGYFFQPPKFSAMFTQLGGEVNSNYPILGNPDLKPEKTIAYELGLNHAVSSDITMGITAYYKDLVNLIATRGSVVSAQTIVTEYVNEDYSSVRGFDVSIGKRRAKYFSGQFNYSFMIARGNSSYELFAYRNYITEPDTTLPTKEYFLDFDQRHTMTLNLDWRTPREWSGKFLFLPLSGAWGFDVVGRLGSGLPYTRTHLKTGQKIGGLNAYRLPSTYTIDTRVNKDFFFNRSQNFLSFFVEIQNLLNRRNVLDVYSGTGLPNDDGVVYGDGGPMISPEEAQRLHRLIVNDPQNYGPPRQLRTGFEFNF